MQDKSPIRALVLYFFLYYTIVAAFLQNRADLSTTSSSRFVLVAKLLKESKNQAYCVDDKMACSSLSSLQA